MKPAAQKGIYKRHLTAITDCQLQKIAGGEVAIQSVHIEAGLVAKLDPLLLSTRRLETIHRHRYTWSNCLSTLAGAPDFAVLDSQAQKPTFVSVYKYEPARPPGVSFSVECALADGTPVQVALLSTHQLDIFSIDGKQKLSSFKLAGTTNIWNMCPGKGFVFLCSDDRNHKVTKTISLTDGMVTDLTDTIGGFAFATYFPAGTPQTGFDNVLFYDQTIQGPLCALQVRLDGDAIVTKPVFTRMAYNTPYTIVVNDEVLIFREKMADVTLDEHWVLIDRRYKKVHPFVVRKVSRYTSSALQQITTRLFALGFETKTYFYLATARGPVLVATWQIALEAEKVFLIGNVGRSLLFTNDKKYYLFDFVAASLSYDTIPRLPEENLLVRHFAAPSAASVSPCSPLAPT